MRLSYLVPLMVPVLLLHSKPSGSSDQPVNRQLDQHIAADNHATPRETPIKANLIRSADKNDQPVNRQSNPTTAGPPIAISPDRIIEVFTGLLAVIGLMQAAIYCALLKASRLSERAWVSLELVEVIGLEEIEKIRKNHKLLLDKSTIGYQLVVQYTLNNSGKTPARIIEGAMAFEMVDETKLPPEPCYLESHKIPYLIAPNRPFRSIQGMVFSRDEIGEFIKNEKSLILFGFVRYLNVHNKLRESRFCLVGQNSPFPQLPIGFDAEHCPPSYNCLYIESAEHRSIRARTAARQRSQIA